jgi:Lon protease-like protein
MKKYELTELPTQLPLLPLNGFTLLPRMQFPISLDQPPELGMLDEALRAPQRMIGVIQPRQTVGDKPPLYAIGTAVRIMAFEEHDDGKYTISVAGVCRFRLTEEISTARDYRLGRVDYSEYAGDLKQREPYHFERRVLVGQLRTFFDGAGIAVDWDAIGSTPDGLLVNSLSILCPFDVAEKQALLEAGTIEKRLETLQSILTFATSPAREAQRVVH